MSDSLWEFGCYKSIGLFYPFLNLSIIQLLVIYVTPMLLIPMEGWSYCRELCTKLLIPFRRQLQGKSWLRISYLMFVTA